MDEYIYRVNTTRRAMSETRYASEPNLLRHTPHAADLQGGSSE